MKVPRTVNRTSQEDFFKLCVRLKDMDLSGTHTLVQLQETLAGGENSQTYATSTLSKSLTAAGIVLPPPPASKRVIGRTSAASDRVWIVAKELAALMKELGKEPSAALTAVVKRQKP